MVAPVGNVAKVVIASNEPIHRTALRLLLENQSELEVVGECDIGDTKHLVKENHPDLLLIHATNPNVGAITAIRTIAPSIPVAVLTRQTHRAYVRACLAAGARAYVLTMAVPADLFAAIRLALQGHRYVDASLHDMLLDVLIRSGGDRSELLSAREFQVLKMLAHGYTNQQIATALSISRKSVDTYRQRLANKLELRDRSEIVRYALATGVLSTDSLDFDDPLQSMTAGD